MISLIANRGSRAKPVTIKGGLAALASVASEYSFFFRRGALHPSAARLPGCETILRRVHPGQRRAVDQRGRGRKTAYLLEWKFIVVSTTPSLFHRGIEPFQ